MTTGAADAFRADVLDFVDKEYFREIGAERVKTKEIRDRLVSADLRRYSHRNRICINIQVMKHSIINDKSNMATACIKAEYKGTSCIIGFMHARVDADHKVHPWYIVNSPTYRSQDGEFRGRLVSWANFTAIYKERADVFEKIEERVVALMEDGKLTFQVDFFFPFKSKDTGEFAEIINNGRIAIKTFVMCWFCDSYHIAQKTIENHVNPAYQLVINQKSMMDLHTSLIEKLGHNEYLVLLKRVSYFWVSEAKFKFREDLQCGQKIFPLTSIEAVKIGDINYPVWREVYVTNLVSNLVLNLVSPCFPFINNWFFIQNAHAGMFDNKAMHDKYAHSKLATIVSARLKDADKYNYINEDQDSTPVSGKFYRLSTQMRKSVVYADSDIKLSDLAVCMTVEYVGRTMRDIPATIADSMGPVEMRRSLQELDLFSKHIFEFLYSFYVMNTKLGIIHGDLHMNNACLNRLYYFIDAVNGRVVAEDPRIAYIVDPETVYLFPHLGIFSTIIDFSRAIVGNYSRLEQRFGGRYAEMYFADQRIRVMHMLYSHFPKLMDEYRAVIEANLLTNFPLMFKIISAVDAYTICSNMLTMFKIDELVIKGEVKISPEIVDLLQRVSAAASSSIIENIRGVAAGKIVAESDIEWPCLAILRDIFARFRMTRESAAGKYNIVEIFNATNELNYDIEDYKMWGPLLSIDKILELRAKHGMEPDVGEKLWLDFVQHDETAEIEKITSKYQQESAETLKYEQWMYS